jgi:hypothetical protein
VTGREKSCFWARIASFDGLRMLAGEAKRQLAPKVTYTPFKLEQNREKRCIMLASVVCLVHAVTVLIL